MSPKLLARILRFRHALELIEAGEEPSIGLVALRCGYYDQSHLVRDFRQFTGFCPTELLARRLPDGAGIREG